MSGRQRNPVSQEAPPSVPAWRRLQFRPGIILGAAFGVLFAVVGAAYLLNIHLFVAGAAPAAPRPGFAIGSDEAFAYLARQHSNFCSLSTATVMGYPDGTRLQGACCSALDKEKYQWQVKGLRRYAGDLPELPVDPYDVPVTQAKTLIAYDTRLTLAADQQTIYDTAMSMTSDKGPCCGHCWRWYMVEGLAKLMIANHSMPATDVAAVVDLINGCGGPREDAIAPSAAT